MPMNLKGRSLDSALNFTTDQINYLIDLAIDLKKAKYQGLHVNSRPLTGKNIAIMFQKDSTRTRCAFEVAAADLGASCTYIGPAGSNFGKKESIEDTAMVLGQFYDGIEFRGFKQADVDAFVKYSGVPVWNGLTDDEHPTQMLADYMTMKEYLGDLKGKKVVFAGDIKNNVARSIMIGAAFVGANVVLCGPKAQHDIVKNGAGHKEVYKACQELFKRNGGSVSFSDDKIKAAKDADVIYTDVWVSLGEDFSLFDSRIKELGDFQVDMAMIKAAKESVIFLHCLPAFHDDHTLFSAQIKADLGKKYPVVATGAMEVTDEVFQSKYNKSIEQAGNRMHSIKAVILATLGY
ncbi:ornithine carbamoyltransferase [Metamycoplasma hyosynoviae]|uniref:ornithine carbamoyltransferase n=1 Tax=Metamycoplasma hyosynoviae TaxID=29559 RepID=UPI00235FAF78|nr:ornithine carbamoyltransferase [Metamycoplasma hyosynoviae]MDD1373459.1 ornithine carbamoyltransferase [Metamycoplasma hyosynoviae]MDD1375545.1 ornithine carbamoyltransferase [Metamycoplasma hyosynoviae]MDD1376243.1 ornithine carbamoyltransferase [Metamycoplasma hyosynoviae]MDD1376844.1 ornithine carbamoyltransferase [Metamycoplasma hyosynoviae]